MTFSLGRVKLWWFLNLVYYAYSSSTGRNDGQNGAENSCNVNVTVTKLSQMPLRLGEEPFYDPDTKSIYFVDIVASQVHRYCLRSKKHYFVQIGTEIVSGVIPIKDVPGQFLITYGVQLCILTWDGTSRRATSTKCFKQPDPRHSYPKFWLDDMKAYPNGTRFAVYSVPSSFYPLVRRQSSLYMFVDGVQKSVLTDLDFGNGLVWSRDGVLFFFSDTLKNSTFKSIYNEKTNTVEDIQLLLNIRKLGVPGNVDSLTSDDLGYLWIAINGEGSRILKVDSKNGRVVCSVKFIPKTGVTNLTFAPCPDAVDSGSNKCIYATSSSSQFAKSPRTSDGGGFFVIQNTGSSGYTSDKVELSAIFGKKRSSEYEELLHALYTTTH